MSYIILRKYWGQIKYQCQRLQLENTWYFSIVKLSSHSTMKTSTLMLWFTLNCFLCINVNHSFIRYILSKKIIHKLIEDLIGQIKNFDHIIVLLKLINIFAPLHGVIKYILYIYIYKSKIKSIKKNLFFHFINIEMYLWRIFWKYF